MSSASFSAISHFQMSPFKMSPFIGPPDKRALSQMAPKGYENSNQTFKFKHEWGVAKGSSVALVAKLKGDKNPE